MTTSLEKVYDVFYSQINIDLTKYPELDVNYEDNIVKTYLEIGSYEYEELLGKELQIDFDNNEILDEIPKSHIRILGMLTYKYFIERELNTTLKIANHFNKRSELQVTGLQSKIVALRESLSRVSSDLNRSFTRNIMKNVGR